MGRSTIAATSILPVRSCSFCFPLARAHHISMALDAIPKIPISKTARYSVSFFNKNRDFFTSISSHSYVNCEIILIYSHCAINYRRRRGSSVCPACVFVCVCCLLLCIIRSVHSLGVPSAVPANPPIPLTSLDENDYVFRD